MSEPKDSHQTPEMPEHTTSTSQHQDTQAQVVEEIGGPEGLEPTRYGDWERKGRCIDF